MAKGVIEKMVDYGTGNPYDDIVEICQTYEDLGQLLTELLEYFGGSGNWDQRAVDFLEEMYSEYCLDALR